MEWQERPERSKEEADWEADEWPDPDKCTVPRRMCCLENPITKALWRISMFFLGADERFLWLAETNAILCIHAPVMKLKLSYLPDTLNVSELGRGYTGVLEPGIISQVDAVPCYGWLTHLIWMNMLMVLLHPGVHWMACLFNVDLAHLQLILYTPNVFNLCSPLTSQSQLHVFFGKLSD